MRQAFLGERGFVFFLFLFGDRFGFSLFRAWENGKGKSDKHWLAFNHGRYKFDDLWRTVLHVYFLSFFLFLLGEVNL